MSTQTFAGARFGEFLLDRNAGGLFRLDDDGISVPLSLGSRALDVLTILVEHRGQLVSKQVIMDAVWPDTAVEENNLTVQISALRRVLDRGRPRGSYIQTVPGRGYRIVAPVRRDQGSIRSPEHPIGSSVASFGDGAASQSAGRSLVTNEPEALSLPDRPSIAVLPFANYSHDPEQEYFAEGMVEEITTALSKIRWNRAQFELHLQGEAR